MIDPAEIPMGYTYIRVAGKKVPKSFKNNKGFWYNRTFNEFGNEILFESSKQTISREYEKTEDGWRLTSEASSTGAWKIWFYNSKGQKIKSVDSKGRTFLFEYNEFGLLSCFRSSLGFVTRSYVNISKQGNKLVNSISEDGEGDFVIHNFYTPGGKHLSTQIGLEGLEPLASLEQFLGRPMITPTPETPETATDEPDAQAGTPEQEG